MPRSRKGGSVRSNSISAYAEKVSTCNSNGITQVVDDESSLCSLKNLITTEFLKVGEDLKAVRQDIQSLTPGCLLLRLGWQQLRQGTCKHKRKQMTLREQLKLLMGKSRKVKNLWAYWKT